MSCACGVTKYAESIWLWTGKGRKLLAEIAACSKCYRHAGDIRKAEGSTLTAAKWAHMKRVHPEPPYYFTMVNGELQPEGVQVQQKPVAQDLAANAKEEPPEEFMPAAEAFEDDVPF